MSNGRIKQQNGEEAHEPNKPVCRVCGETPHDGNGDWPIGTKVFHCKGISHAFSAKLKGQYHHSAVRLHNPCMVCGADLGCPRCSGPTYELLCVARVPFGAPNPNPAAHWGHEAALRKHGRLLISLEDRRKAATYLHDLAAKIKVELGAIQTQLRQDEGKINNG
jgi:hypothetical protein